MGVCGGRSATRHQQVVAKLPLSNNHLSSISGNTNGGQQQRTTSSGLLLSDIIEGSCSSSSGNSHSCTSLNIESANYSKNPHHHQNIEMHSGQHQLLPSFVNCSDGSIFTLASNSQIDSIHQVQQNLQDNSIYMLAQEVNGVGDLNSINSSLANNNKSYSNSVVAEQFGGSSNLNHNHQQQHRRLQHQVHQQLQQIYGNAGRQAQRLAANQIGSRQVQARQSSQQQQQRFIDHHQHHQTNSSQSDEQSIDFSIGENRSKLQQRGRQQHSIKMMNQQEQIYDPLVGPASVISRGYNKVEQQQQQQPQQQQSETINYYGQNIHQQHICSIPEESNDEEDELLLPEKNNNSASSSLAVSSSSSKMVAINRRRNHLEDLHYATVTAAALLSATANAAAALASTGGGGGDRNENCVSKQRTKTAATAAAVKDNQAKKVEAPGDESSHASLAAPFHHQQQSATKITTARNNRANASIYSEAYQEVSSSDRRRRDGIETRVANQTNWYRQQQQKQQQQNRVYSDVMDSNNIIRERFQEIRHLQHNQIRPNVSAATDAIYGTQINSKVTANPNYAPNNNRIYQQQRHQQMAAKLLVNNAGLVRPPQPPPNRRPLPQFAAVANATAPKGTEMLIRQPHLNDQYRLYLQQQQQQRVLAEMGSQMLPGQVLAAAAAANALQPRTTPVVPAHTFTIFQKPSSHRKKQQPSSITDQASIRADLINKLLIANSHHHHQRVNAVAFVNTDNNNNNNNLNAAAVVNAHYAQQHYAMLGNKLRSISNETHKQNLFPGHLIEQKNDRGGKGGEKLYVAAIPHQRSHQHHSSIFPIAPPPAALLAASSNSSSNSSVVPLVLDRNIRPPGFIERICQIDLRLFWWSLLIVCFFFIGIIITISRYVF